ncbi:hypothetical protein [Streptomyces sp. NTK 937]|uniref:hypothetical protein n=1 Tax=Streptomyces sp. NTK 937 TaxID=1487711 RepID=UPI0004A8D13D|nr:hypothetical protein [Streptomyces sp. NTK 937]KDQ65762.1 hypothetical protein DT87_00465 [Streptomyces sp. NTK 937]
MTYRSKYVGKYSGLGRMVSRPWMGKPCRDAAVRIMHSAEGFSPVGDPAEDRHPGLYKASFSVEPVFRNIPFRGKPRMRHGAMVVNTAPHAKAVEYGNWNIPRYAPLTKAYMAALAEHANG